MAIAALIFFASSQSKIAGPSIEGIDKVAHFCVYGLLATLVVRLGNHRRFAWVALVLVSAYGITDEWHQSFTPGRSVEFADWLADTLGAALAIFLYRTWTWYRTRLERSLWRKQRVETATSVITIAT
ncbi:MAG: VanZ family protein [Opitutus sp.]